MLSMSVYLFVAYMSISPLLFDKVKQKLDVFLTGTIGGIVEFCSGSFILVLNEGRKLLKF